MYLWFFLGLAVLIGAGLFIRNGSRTSFVILVTSVVLAFSYQLSLTVLPDRFIALAKQGETYLLYESPGRESVRCDLIDGVVSRPAGGVAFSCDLKSGVTRYDGEALSASDVHNDKRIGTRLIRVTHNGVVRLAITGLFFGLLLVSLYAVGAFRTKDGLYDIFTSARILWGRLWVIEKTVLFVFPLVFCLSTTGVDISIFNDVILLNSSDIDICYYQSLLRLGHWDAQYAPFPYPPFTASIFTPFITLLTPLVNLLGAHFGSFDSRFVSPQLLPIKMAIWYLYLTAALLFASNVNIFKVDGKKLFYAYLLFPVSFYISGFYGHIDAVTLLVLSIGLSLLLKPGSTGMFFVFVALLMSTKIQTVIFVPILVTPLFFVWSQRLSRLCGWTGVSWKNWIGATVFFLATNSMPLLNKNLSVALFDYPQNTRVWFTVLTYAPGLHLYFSLLALMFAYVVWMFMVEWCEDDETIVAAVVFGVAICSLWFFSAMIFTHSFLSVCAPAFALVVASPRVSSIRKLCLTGLALGAMANLMFFINGDVSRIFLQRTWFSKAKEVQFMSMMHTVATGSLLLAGVVLLCSFRTMSKARQA